MKRSHVRALIGAALAGLWAAACGRAVPDAPDPMVRHIASPAPGESGQPNLAVGPEGEVYLSWIEATEAGEHRLRFATLADTIWSEPRTIAAGADWFVNWADFPMLADLGGGRLAAHFLQRRPGAEQGYHYDVRIVQSLDHGSTWSQPITPYGSTVAAEYGFVSLFPTPAGELGVVWLDGRAYDPAEGGTEEMSLRYAELDRSGNSGQQVVIDGRICDCCQTSVALMDGRPALVYRDRSPEEIRDISISRLEGEGWTEGVAVHRDGWRIDACPVNGPAIATGRGATAVAWFTAADDQPRVLTAFADGGGGFAAPVRVDDGEPLGRVGVAVTGAGAAVVVWMERAAGDRAEVRYRRLTPTGPAGASRTIGTTGATRASGFPRVVASGNRLVFAWTETGPVPIVRTATITLEERN